MSTELNKIIRKMPVYKETNCSTLYKDHNDIYKIIERNIIFYQDMINNISYNYSIHNNVNNNIILPADLVVDNNHIRGYKCNYVDGKNLDKLGSDLSIEDKIKVLNNLTSLLQEVNNYLVVGDINLSNCMYDKYANSYLIDFDLSTSLDKTPSWLTLYNFRNKHTKREIISNLNTDKLKMAIVTASVLYNTDFERSFIFRKPYSKWDKYYQYTNNQYLKDYYKQAFHDLNNNNPISDYLYLPTNKSFINDIENDIKLIKEKIK